ncbi:MAG: ABC transporter ATP-binding protein [Actinomycetota bacterium]|nr:ABC transporter ATP-binding protein [Actinomycetota bacterium]
MPVIEVEGLVKTYGAARVVDGVSFTVEPGEIFGIVGPNGAGKTTIVESMVGLRRPDGGTIRVLGLDPLRDRAELTRRVGVQLQGSTLQDRIRVDEVMRLYSSFHDEPLDWRDLLEVLGLGERLRASYADLSGGQKQRLAAALALLGAPEVVVLDELTTGLDPHARRDTWDTIERTRDAGVTVVLVTHFMDEAERLCDRLMVVRRGRVVAVAPPDELVRRLGADQRLRFRPSRPLDETLLADVAGVATVERDGSRVVVTGTGDLGGAVVAFLAARHTTAEDLRASRPDLEDAYLALTGGPDEALAPTTEVRS